LRRLSGAPETPQKWARGREKCSTHITLEHVLARWRQLLDRLDAPPALKSGPALKIHI
jgi:hypothetical protein